MVQKTLDQKIQDSYTKYMANELTEQVAFGLAKIGAALRTAQWRAGEQSGLTPTQIGILTTLHRLGADRVQALAGQLGVTHATASDAVAALHGKGLVEKSPDPRDGRAVLVGLTESGRRAAQDSGAYPPELLTAVARLRPDDQAGLRRSLTGIIRSLQESGLIEPQRLCVTCRFFRPNAHPGSDKPHHCAFVDAAFGDASLRLDCGDHEEADDADKARQWTRFLEATSD